MIIRHLFKRLPLVLLWCALPCFAQVSVNEDYETANNLYRHGHGKPIHYPQALEAFIRAAKEGHPSAQFYAGRMYQLGHGTEADGEKAAYWYGLAGLNGQARAYNNLGNIHAHGQDVPKDGQKAMSYYLQASQMGMAMGSYNVAQVYTNAWHGFDRDFGKAREYYRRCLQQYPNYPGAWNNLGRVLRASDDHVESDYEGAEQAFLQAIAQDDRYAYWNLADLYYDGRRPASGERIVQLLEQGARKNHTLCLNRLAWFHKEGEFIDQDMDKAIYYYGRSAAQGNAIAQNWLANLLKDTGREAPNSPRVIKLYRESAESGNRYAMNNLGYTLVVEDVEGGSPDEGIALLIEAAKKGHDDALQNLKCFLSKPETSILLTDEQRDWVEAQSADKKQAAKAAAREILNAIAPLVSAKDYSQALEIVEKRYRNWKGPHKNEYAFLSALWWDAQTQQGRADPEWSWRLFDWLKEQYDRDFPKSVYNRLTVRLNLDSALTECGRLGRSRQLSDEILRLLAELDGIRVDEILRRHQADGEPFPLRYGADMLTRYQDDDAEGTWISNASMDAILTVAGERALAADWASALLMCDWIEAWGLAVLESGKIPRGAVGGFVMDTYLGALRLRAGIYGYRQQFSDAQAINKKIVDLNWSSYDGLKTHAAQTSYARSLKGEQAPDFEALEAIARARKANQYESEDGYQYTRLVIAELRHAEGEQEIGHQMVDEILAYAIERNRPFLKQAALLTSVDLALEEGRLDHVEARLFAALNWVQSKGLKVREPAIYSRYADYLGQVGDLNAALAITRKRMELLRNLDAEAGLPQARAKVAELREAIAQKAQSSAPDLSFDLQPMRMTSVPLPGQGVEAIFTLSNLGAAQSEILLQAQGNQGIKFFEALAEADPILIFMPGPNQPTQDEFEVALDAQEQRFIRVQLPEPLPEDGDVQLTLVAKHGDTEVTSDLIIQTDFAAASTAILEAHELEDNPFYLVSAFHHLANANPDRTKTVALRAVASQPTRVEAYDFEGNLLFIDAQGNGQFTDPGDVLATGRIAGGAPVLDISTPTHVIELRYQPLQELREPIDIELQRAEASAREEWTIDAVDQLLPFRGTE